MAVGLSPPHRRAAPHPFQAGRPSQNLPSHTHYSGWAMAVVQGDGSPDSARRVRRERGACSERASPSPSTPRNPHPPPPHTHAHTPPTADAGNVRVGLQQVDDREAIGARAERLCRRRGRDEHDGRVARLHQRAHVHVLEALWGGRAALLSRYLAAPSAVESAAWGVAAWRARCTHTISTHPRR